MACGSSAAQRLILATTGSSLPKLRSRRVTTSDGDRLHASQSPLKGDPERRGTHLEAVRSMVFTQGGALLVTLCHRDATSELRVWRCTDQVLLATAQVKPARISLGLAPWGGLVGTPLDSRTPSIAVWDLPTPP